MGLVWPSWVSVHAPRDAEDARVAVFVSSLDDVERPCRFVQGYEVVLGLQLHGLHKIPAMKAKSGWWFQPTPLKNMSSSVGMMTFPIYGKS